MKQEKKIVIAIVGIAAVAFLINYLHGRKKTAAAILPELQNADNDTEETNQGFAANKNADAEKRNLQTARDYLAKTGKDISQLSDEQVWTMVSIDPVFIEAHPEIFNVLY